MAREKPSSPYSLEYLKLTQQPISFAPVNAPSPIINDKIKVESPAPQQTYMKTHQFESPAVNTNRHFNHLQAHSGSRIKDVIGSPCQNTDFLGKTMTQHHNVQQTFESPYKEGTISMNSNGMIKAPSHLHSPHKSKFCSPNHRINH